MKKRFLAGILGLALLFTGAGIGSSSVIGRFSEEVYAADVFTTSSQVISYLELVLSDKGNTQAVFRTDFAITAEKMGTCIEKAAIEAGRMLQAGVGFTTRQISDNVFEYDVALDPASFVDVVVLNSEKSAYSHALKALKKMDYTTVFYSENNMYYDTFYSVLQQHPEYDYFTGVWNNSTGCCGFGPADDSISVSDIKKKMKKTDKKAQKVVDSIIEDDMSAKEKYKAIHDYLVKNCKYDMDAAGLEGDVRNDAFTAYGCLINKKAVCQGYSAAFNLLCSKAGIVSMGVAGTAGGDAHGWNMVKVGSDYRYIDVTWDDPVPDRGDKVQYNYYLLTADEMSRDHNWKKTTFAVKYLKYSKYAFD